MEEELSNINALGASITLCMGILMLLVPRRFALLPLIIVSCYITLGQTVNLAGFNFTMLRFMILFGWLRLLLKKEMILNEWNIIDKTFIWWVIASIVIYVLKRPSTEDLVNRLGFAYNAAGLYFLCRFLIRDYADIERVIKMFAFVICPLALMMLFERATGGRNMFAILGGVPFWSEIRNGSVRCQGSFRHPILAGTFGATLLPYFVALWLKKPRSSLYALAGLVSSTVITLTAASSGPLLAYLLGLLGMLMWLFRKSMRIIRWSILLIIVALQIVMKAPVWYLIARASSITGGGGWHRSDIIDQAIRHLDEWWLAGTTYTAHWMATSLAVAPENADITNQYISEGVQGGIIKMGLFIAIIALCFRNVGKAVSASEERPLVSGILVWSLGSALFAHVAGYFSVAYFDQIVVSWYLLLAMIASLNNLNVNASGRRVKGPILHNT